MPAGTSLGRVVANETCQLLGVFVGHPRLYRIEAAATALIRCDVQPHW